MSALYLSSIKCNTEGDTKETAASSKKQNSWSTPFVFNNDCMKKVMDFCNVYQIFRLTGVNRHCRHIASQKYSDFSFYLRTLHSSFTEAGTFAPPTFAPNKKENTTWWNNLKRDIVFKNGDVRLLKYDECTQIGEDQDVFLKIDKETIKVEDKESGICLDKFTYPYCDAKGIISAFRISPTEHITVFALGEINKHTTKKYLCSFGTYHDVKQIYCISNVAISKVVKIEDKMYLLCKTVYFRHFKSNPHNLYLICYDMTNNTHSTFCEGSTRNFNTFNPIVNCIANKTHLFVIFEYGAACYDNQHNCIWLKNDVINTTNENAILELSDKFLLITSCLKNAHGVCTAIFYKVINIANGEIRDLKSSIEHQLPNETFNFWGNYIISQKSYGRSADIEFWNPNNGKLIICVHKQFPYNSYNLLPLKNNGGLIWLSHRNELERPTLLEEVFGSNLSKLVNVCSFFLLKAPGIQNKKMLIQI